MDEHLLAIFWETETGASGPQLAHQHAHRFSDKSDLNASPPRGALDASPADLGKRGGDNRQTRDGSTSQAPLLSSCDVPVKLPHMVL